MKLLKDYIFPRLILDILTFYVFLVIVAVIAARLSVSIEVAIGLLINYLMLAFAFIYNDLKDREDDEKSPFKNFSVIEHLQIIFGVKLQEGYKRFRNPFVGDEWVRTGYTIIAAIFALSLVASYLLGGHLFLAIAFSNLIIGLLYSGGFVRLKKYPIVDIFSHAYLLAGVQIIFFFAYEEAVLDIKSYSLLFSIFIFSMAGDLANEYRDFKEDQETGLKNTASFLGKKNTKIMGQLLQYFSLAVSVVLLASVIIEK